MKTVARKRKPTNGSEKAGQWQAVCEDLKGRPVQGALTSRSMRAAVRATPSAMRLLRIEE
mgnify:CR=1 FL=1